MLFPPLLLLLHMPVVVQLLHLCSIPRSSLSIIIIIIVPLLPSLPPSQVIVPLLPCEHARLSRSALGGQKQHAVSVAVEDAALACRGGGGLEGACEAAGQGSAGWAAAARCERGCGGCGSGMQVGGMAGRPW